MRGVVLRQQEILGDALAARRHLLARLARAGAAEAPPFAPCSITSGLLITPPRPVPCTVARSTFCSAATRCAAGETLACPEDGGAGASGAAGAAAGAAAFGASAFGASAF